MNNKLAICLIALLHFSNIHSMEVAEKYSFINENSLQRLALCTAHSPTTIVKNIQEYAQQNNIAIITPQIIKSFLKWGDHKINQVFLNKIDDDDLRRLTYAMGADIKARIRGNTCLFQTKNPYVLAELLSWGAEVNAMSDSSKATPLYFHCSLDTINTIEIARLLLEKGADPEPTQLYTSPLLHKAIDDKNSKLVKLLCEHKAKMERGEVLGRTALINAVRKGVIDIVEILLIHGASPATPDKSGSYPLHEALPKKPSKNFPPKETYLAIIALLLQYKADPNISYPPVYEKNFPLHRAVEIGDIELIAMLRHAGANKNLCNARGKTPLDLAHELGSSTDILELLSADILAPPLPPRRVKKTESSDVLPTAIDANQSFDKSFVIIPQDESPEALETQDKPNTLEKASSSGIRATVINFLYGLEKK